MTEVNTSVNTDRNAGGQGMALEVDNISKSFPGVKALQNVSFRAEPGKVLALLGENGAGKSTLLKVLSGDIKPDEGEVRIGGVPQKFDAPVQAIQAGISVIYQERQLVPSMSVLENIYCGDLPATKAGFLKKKEMRQTAERIIQEFGLEIDPFEKLGRLSTAHQQMVRLIFQGAAAATRPLIASMAIDRHIAANILSATTRTLDGKVYGTMLLNIPGGPDELAKALKYISGVDNVAVQVEAQYNGKGA